MHSQMDLIAERSQLLYGNGDLNTLVTKLKANTTDPDWNLFLSICEKVFFDLQESEETCYDTDKVMTVLLRIASFHPGRTPNGLWFGGVTKVSSNIAATLMDKFASALLVGISLVAERNAAAVSCLKVIERNYTSLGEFVFKVGKQDDRLLGCLLALIKLKVHTQERELPCNMSYMNGEWIERDGRTKIGLKLQLIELAGARVVHKDVLISNEEPKRVFTPFKVEIDQEPYFELLYDMLVRLRFRLEAISSKKELGNYRAIINLIQKFENLVDNSEITENSTEEIDESPPPKRSKQLI